MVKSEKYLIDGQWWQSIFVSVNRQPDNSNDHYFPGMLSKVSYHNSFDFYIQK